MTTLRKILLVGTVLPLAACGADDVASPGAGTIIVNPPAPAPSPSPSPSPSPTPNITAAQFAGTGGSTGATAITAEESLALATGGTNNNVNGTRPFANPAQPFAAQTTLPTATDPTTFNTGGSTFFSSGSYLGAFSGAGDTNFRDWTCDSPSAQFNTTAKSCNAVPLAVVSPTPAANACPAGTTDAGTNSNFRLCAIPNLITSDLTLPQVAGVVYLLNGPTEVGVDVGPTGAAAAGDPAVLTIAAGVVIAANPADAANDVLLVNRGSQIQAVGTATQPIIFTSRQNLSGTGTSDSTQGQWGGIILLGQAPTGVCRTGTGPNDAAGSSTTCENQIEGVTSPRFYGGPTVASNSGRFQYVQIRFTGIDISAGGGNELQGLTLGGVGSGTQIDHVQSHNSADDGIEIFGGTSNLKYVAITGADDDGLDVDNGWRGLVQFLVVAQKPNGATTDSFSMEIDSDNNEDLLPRTYGQISNFTFIHTASTTAAIRLRGGADFRFANGIIQSSVPCLNLVAQQQSASDRTTIRAANSTLQDVGPPVFTSVYFACSNR